MNRIDRLTQSGWLFGWCLAIAAIAWPASAHAVRIKEVASIQGVRSNQLVGYGIVVGLAGDGDSNAAPSGGVRQLQYKLKPGEATWRLVVDRVVGY
jgi:hypothetical protein